MVIRDAVNASEKDVVLFVGSGCTAAVHKLIHCLELVNKTHPPVFVLSFCLPVWLLFVKSVVVKIVVLCLPYM